MTWVSFHQNAIVNGLKRAAQYFGFPEDFGGTPRTPLKKDEGTPRTVLKIETSNK